MLNYSPEYLGEPVKAEFASVVGSDNTPEWEKTCAEYFGKIFDEPLHHFNADRYSDLNTGEVIQEIEAYAAIGDTNEAYFDDREQFNIFETNS